MDSKEEDKIALIRGLCKGGSQILKIKSNLKIRMEMEKKEFLHVLNAEKLGI